MALRVYRSKIKVDNLEETLPTKKTLKTIDAAAKARAADYAAQQKQQELRKVRNSRDNRIALIASAGAVVLALVLQLGYFGFGPGSVNPSPTASSSANSALVPSPELAEGRTWSGSIEINGKPLTVEIDGANAPQAAANFLSLANSGFYSGNTCHRLVTAGIYVLQCGDPNGDGTGDPGYKWGPIENAPADDSYKTGVLAMARQSGDGSTMGSQFFIVYEDSVIPSDAAGGYTVFGKITGDLSAIDDVIAGGVEGGGTDGKPAVEAKISAISLK
ncbi:hypothetical protein RKAS3_06330 [Rhodoluna sp. KAS3]|jgi:peptidyl-prolyl cis-trans isomerase B (cyclophilin B)|nr:hypothetical protein RKAS3_06330 [Rhodoluna sp. KAS3]